MKLKCDDGVTREFETTKLNPYSGKYTESYCVECGEEFGVHDTKILKPEFKKHICEIKISQK